MALVRCPECGNGVSDRAESCPSCAFPLAEGATPQAYMGRNHRTEQQGENRHKHRQYLILLVISALVTALFALKFSSPPASISPKRTVARNDYRQRTNRADAKVKGQRTSRADAKVKALVAEAETAWQEGNSLWAETKLHSASRIVGASNLGLIRQLHVRMANAQVVSLVKKAEEAW